MLRKLWGWMVGEKRRGRFGSPGRMRREEVVGCFAGVSAETPLWKGVMWCLNNEITERIESALDGKLSDGEVKYRLGGADALGDLRDVLMDKALRAREVEGEDHRPETERP